MSSRGGSEHPGLPWPGPAALELDDLLEELRQRAGAARRGQQQTQAMLDAVLAISGDLELAEVLRRIVSSACALVGARYGALGVLGPDRSHLMEFVTHGLSQQEQDLIGDPPRGHGILGLLIRDPRPRRIADISTHPEASGLPADHPPMQGFLGVPIRIRGEVYGNLYLTEKQDGTQFSAADESLLVALAAAAGVALHNARLYAQSELQRNWSLALSEVSQSLLHSGQESPVLQGMVQRVCRVSGAVACVVVLHGQGQDAAPVIAAGQAPPTGDRIVDPGGVPASGPDALTGEHWTSALDAARPLLILPDLGEAPAQPIVEDVRRIAGVPQVGPTALVPITAGQSVIGALLPVWRPGEADAASAALEPLAEFALQVGIALVASRAQRDRATVLLLEDRERIARDMHDLVIQRLFATGLSLQVAGRLAQHPVVRGRLQEAIVELDSAISDTRQVIYQLHAMATPSGLQEKVARLVRGYSETLGFEVSLQTGQPDGVDPGLEMDVLAVVREGLANVVRHAQATQATVALRLGPTVQVEIVDNGVGIGSQGGRRSGLLNLHERASARSGHCEVVQVQPHGTRITWTAPVTGHEVDDRA